MKRLLLLLTLLLCAPWTAWAACSSCSTAAASCAAGSTQTEVQNCVNAMPNDGVLTFATGSYAMSIRLDQRNGITVQCETAPLTVGAASTNPCTFSSQNAFSWDTTSTHATNLIRISGFRFTNATGPSLTFGRTYENGWIDKLRIDHNTFTGQANSIAFGHGANPAGYQMWGVIDSNLFEGSSSTYPIQILGADNSDWTPALAGTGNAIFVEDNTFTYSSDSGAGSCLDAWRGSRVVARFNTNTNCRFSVHGICHNGPALFEVYENSINGTSGLAGYRNIHHQGSGEIIAFNNVSDGASASMEIQHYRSSITNPEAASCTGRGIQATCDGTWASDGNRSGQNGYPCYRQPGRDSAGTMRPIYLWNNVQNGTRAAFDINDAGTPSYLTDHMQADRDYYETTAAAQTSATLPFNGTTGMGWGTLANRPTTCATNATTGDSAGCAGTGCGVGYWATDGGSNWNTSNGPGNDGGLYICSDADTWTLYYTPYTYPHPLRNQSTQPDAPSNFRLIQWGLAILLGAFVASATFVARKHFRPAEVG